MRYTNILLLAIAEVVYGTPPAMTGADAIQTSNLKCMPLEGSTVPWNRDRPAFGNDIAFHVGVHVAVEFDVALVGSGTLGTAPGWGKLLIACGCTETVVAVTSVKYKPNSASTDSVAIKFYLDGQLHALSGCKGTFSIKTDSQGIPFLHFKFIGIWSDPTSEANPTGLTGWNAFQQPEPVTFDNTAAINLHSYDAVLRTFNFEQGNVLEYFDNPGEQFVDIVDRESKASITVIAPVLSSKNYFTAAKANTLGNLKLEHGTVSNKLVFFEAADNRVQLLQPKYGEYSGRATLEGNLNFVPTTALDDEWELRLAAA
ncbi:MAG: hypothetical protein HYV17_08055 [Xanthomonadales bacterium]|nr:hypothetical protein [Xanthomonadales bacterium]